MMEWSRPKQAHNVLTTGNIFLPTIKSSIKQNLSVLFVFAKIDPNLFLVQEHTPSVIFFKQ
jgi:hypothetical protein